VSNVGVLWPTGWIDQDETWHAVRPLPWPQCVRWGPSSPVPQTGTAPQFSAHACCGQMAGWIKMPLGREVWPPPKRHCFRWGPSSASPKRGQSPQYSAHVYYGQTAGWIKMALGAEVGLDSGHIVLDRDPALPLQKGGTSPNFRPMSIVVKWLDGSRCHLVWM